MIAIAQWQKTWRQLGVDGSAELYALIEAQYIEPDRKYHTQLT